MKVAIIGCGTMGSAFARCFALKHEVILFSRNAAQAQALAAECGAKVAQTSADAAAFADVIVLGVKPKDLAVAAEGFSQAMKKGKILLSMLGGTSLEVLRRHFPLGQVIRMMPNLALMYGQGVVGLVDDGLSTEVKTTVETLLEGMGLTPWMSEQKLDALAALSGSGVGFIFLMLEAMMEGGIFLGFTSQEAKEFVLKTMEGAVAMVRESGKHPAELKLNISSPGGTTIVGLKEMEDRGVRSGIINAIIATHRAAMKH